MAENTKLAECMAEIERLKMLLSAAERKNKVRTARVEFYPNGAKLGMIITMPSAVDEIEFGKFVATQMAMLLNVGGVTKIKTGNFKETPHV